MINVVYLVLVVFVEGSAGKGVGITSIPQANMTQCQVNMKNYNKKGLIDDSYCIVGVIPK